MTNYGMDIAKLGTKGKT